MTRQYKLTKFIVPQILLLYGRNFCNIALPVRADLPAYSLHIIRCYVTEFARTGYMFWVGKHMQLQGDL